ncbi:MAG: sugar phosphate isomerase/epimerase [Verrucomicrobiales bacterium]|nr:sugar phosphate isomerase/epimerase [Verrucomicrobiales bacterium]
MTSTSFTRRHFLHSAAALTATGLLPRSLQADPDAANALAGRIYKTLKIGMVQVPGGLVEKFRAAKAAGFQGIELNAPGFDVKEVRQAIEETGLPVDGTVGSSHWKIRHTDPDPAVRKEALQTQLEALRQTHAVGGSTSLIVLGRGDDGTPEEVWARATENIAQAIPLAAELGVTIAIENVWNQFLYNHDGGVDQSAEEFVKFVDQFQSPFVAMHFDIGNHWKYGNIADWIRQLGKRIVKLDVKGFSRAEDKFMPIGEGDIDFTSIRKALLDINYYGWLAAEVKGGDVDALKVVAGQMDQAFGL